MSKTSKMRGFLKKFAMTCAEEQINAFQQQQVAGLQVRRQPEVAADRQQQHSRDERRGDDCRGEAYEINYELAQLQYVPLPDIDDENQDE